MSLVGQQRQGFTIIELMVVVTIIGILSAVLLSSFDQSRKQSRDKIRKAELKELQLAVELYKAQFGTYPARGCGETDSSVWTGPGTQPGWATACTNYIDGLVPDFSPSLPEDPNQESQSGKGFVYLTDSTRSSYKIMVYDSVEAHTITSFTDEFSRCPNSSGACSTVCPSVDAIADTYAVYSAGAECW